jgi:hypothetical protein
VRAVVFLHPVKPEPFQQLLESMETCQEHQVNPFLLPVASTARFLPQWRSNPDAIATPRDPTTIDFLQSVYSTTSR